MKPTQKTLAQILVIQGVLAIHEFIVHEIAIHGFFRNGLSQKINENLFILITFNVIELKFTRSFGIKKF